MSAQYPQALARYFEPDHTAHEVADLMGEKGFRTLWIKPRSKAPGLTDWPNKASSHPDAHARWFAGHPERGLGWAMGPQDDGRFLIALDVDVAKDADQSLKLLEAADPNLIDRMLAGWLQRTGSGGFHYVFEVDPSLGAKMRTGSSLMPGIDVRAGGGQICVYPTRHPSGQIYRWRKGGEPWI